MSVQEPFCIAYLEEVRRGCAPRAPTNNAGLAAIEYRIGSFASFRRAMLDHVAYPDLLNRILALGISRAGAVA